jgi:hypothetical protein
MGGPKNRGYKRSWKNLLLNKSYQLRFTLFMVGLSAVLMGLLGWWVLDVASTATVTALNNIRGAECRNPLAEVEPVIETPPGERREVMVETSAMQFVDPATPSANPSNDETAVVVPPRTGPSAQEKELALRSYERCVEEQRGRQQSLHDRERLILWVLIGVGGLLVLGLFGFGIKMTHRVAGPLYKVQLYFKKLRDGKYDKVYNLRKGDQLVEFYELFKSAHDGLRGMQEQGVDEFRRMIEAAEKADLASKSPEIAAALEEMRAILKKKEESLG